MSFLWELKRRNIFNVAFAYVIAAGLFVLIGSKVFLALNLPNWTVTFVVVLLILGFPFVLFITWAKATPADKEISPTPVVGDVEEAAKTIAVLPFEDLSPGPGQEYFVDGLSEELLNRLTKVPGLLVIARTSSFAFKGSDKKVNEIAKELGVDHILEGSVRKDGEALRITAQLVRAVDGSYLWSKIYNRELKDIFVVQEDIATAVAKELKASLGIKKPLLSLGGTNNLEAYELYLFAQGQIREGDLASLSRCLKSIDAALAKDHKFALAWARKAVVHNFIVTSVPANRVPEEQDAGLHAAKKAIELEPDLAEAYASMGYNRTLRGDWIEAESAYRKAFDLATESITVTVPAIPLHYLAVGYFEKAHKFIEEIRRDDPFNNPNRAWHFFSFGLLGNTQRAEVEFDRGRELFGEKWQWGNYFITMLRIGTGGAVSGDDILTSDPICDYAKGHLESPEEALREMRRFYTYYDNQDTGRLPEIPMWAAYFGDPDFAMGAMEKAVSLNASNMVFFWLPLLRAVRHLPRFKEFVKEIGLVAYWNQYGWPDFCRKLENGDFECY